MKAYRKWRGRTSQIDEHTDATDTTWDSHKVSKVPFNSSHDPNLPKQSYDDRHAKLATFNSNIQLMKSLPSSPILGVDIVATSSIKTDESPLSSIDNIGKQQGKKHPSIDLLVTHSSATQCISMTSTNEDDKSLATYTAEEEEEATSQLTHNLSHHLQVTRLRVNNQKSNYCAQRRNSSSTDNSTNEAQLDCIETPSIKQKITHSKQSHPTLKDNSFIEYTDELTSNNINGTSIRDNILPSKENMHYKSTTNLDSNTCKISDYSMPLDEHKQSLPEMQIPAYGMTQQYSELPETIEPMPLNYYSNTQQEQEQLSVLKQSDDTTTHKSKKNKKKKGKKHRHHRHRDTEDNDKTDQQHKKSHKKRDKSTTAKKALLALPERYRRPVRGLERPAQLDDDADDRNYNNPGSYNCMDSTKGLMSNGTHQNLSAGHGESGVQCWSERDLERVMEKQMAQIQAQREKEAARRVRQQADEARRERLLNQWKSMVNDKLSSPPPPPSSSLSALPPRSMLIAKNNQSSSGRHRNSRMANLPLEQPDHRLASPSSTQRCPSESTQSGQSSQVRLSNFNAIQNGAQPTGRHGRPWASMPIEPQPLPPFNNGQPNYIRHQTLGVSRRNSGSTHSGNSNGRGRIHRWLSESYVVATPSDVSPSPPVSFQQMPMSQQHHLQFRDGWSINSGDIPENTSTASPQLPLAQLSFNQQHPAYPSNIPLGYHNATNPTSSLMQSQLNSGHYYMNNAYNMSTHYNHAGPNGYLPSNGQPMRYTPGYPTIDTSKPWNSANYSHALNRHSSSGYGLRNRSTSSKKSITSDNDDNQPLTNGLLMRLPKQHPMSGRSSSSGNGQPLISSMYVPPASSAAAVPFNTQQYQQPTMSANRSNTMLSGYPLTSNGHRFSGTLLNEHNSLLLSSSPQQPQISNCSYEQPNYYGHNNSHNPQLGKQDPNKTISTIVGSEEEAMAAWTSVGAPPACINGWRGIASMRQQRQQQQQQQQQRCSLPSAQAMLTNTTVSSSITTATTVTAMANKPTNTAHPVYPDSVENSEDGSVSSSSSSSETSSSDSFSSSTQSLH